MMSDNKIYRLPMFVCSIWFEEDFNLTCLSVPCRTNEDVFTRDLIPPFTSPSEFFVDLLGVSLTTHLVHTRVARWSGIAGFSQLFFYFTLTPGEIKNLWKKDSNAQQARRNIFGRASFDLATLGYKAAFVCRRSFSPSLARRYEYLYILLITKIQNR